MQELNVQPSNATPYTPVGGTYNNNPVPGAGGLPALSGLNNRMNPMAEELQQQGRGEDSMLVHMTPEEVNSLQGLAMAHGGSLTINPETGLPEAGFLKKLLPTILGAALAATGVGAPLAAGLVAAGSVAKTGSLKKGLMAGLSAYGGASLAGGLGLGGSLSKTGFGTLSKNAGIFGSNMGLGALPTVVPGAVAGAGNVAQNVVGNVANPLGLPPVEGAIKVTGNLAGATAGQAAGTAAAKQGLAGVAQRFGQTAAQGLPGGIIGKAAPMIAASGLMQGVTGAMTPSGGGGGIPGADGRVDNSYQGPYYAQQRKPVFTGTTEDILAGEGGQQRYFDVDMPEIYNTMGQVVQPGSNTVRGTQIMQPVLNPSAKKEKDNKGRPMYSFMPTTYMGGIDPNPGTVAPNQAMIAPDQDYMYNYTGYAAGGEVDMRDGSFVVDARTVSELGNGSSNAGMEFLSHMGGRPLQGPGDGVSDSIRARIGGKQEARVARDEVLFPPEAVKRLGDGSAAKGTAKLYSLMDKAHKARKKANRGQDTKLRHGLG